MAQTSGINLTGSRCADITIIVRQLMNLIEYKHKGYIFKLFMEDGNDMDRTYECTLAARINGNKWVKKSTITYEIWHYEPEAVKRILADSLIKDSKTAKESNRG